MYKIKYNANSINKQLCEIYPVTKEDKTELLSINLRLYLLFYLISEIR